MQFTKSYKIAVAEGRLTVSFRYWRSPQARAGGRYQIRPYGAFEVDDVRTIDPAAVTDADARAAGFADRATLRADLDRRRRPGAQLYRVALHFIGELEDPRETLRETALDDAAFVELAHKLARMDAREPPWTTRVLTLIRNRPGERAGNLAPELGWETPRFKTQVRKLKAQGLTESLEVGYRLSPRGVDYLDRVSP
jgi:hypothetical protein